MDLPGRGALRGRAGGGAHGERALSFEALRRQFDRNNDGRIEKSEVAPALHRRFDELDANGDGVLTKDDFGN
jgi:Ca2+-binding EF-hand superfamily protein